MRKLLIIRSLSVIAAALFASCSEDGLPEADVGRGVALQISVTAAGFTSDSPVTRSADADYTTTFTTGDRIGITAISVGTTILENNIPYEYDGSAWKPVNPSDVVTRRTEAGITWLVYYPYSTDMDDMTTIAAITAAFTPQADQSALSDYAASDLMTGIGTLSENNLNVTLTHALALIELNLLPAMSESPALSVNRDQALTPYNFNGTWYRFIVKPTTNAIVDGVYYIGGVMFAWQQTGLNLNAGEYTQLIIP